MRIKSTSEIYQDPSAACFDQILYEHVGPDIKGTRRLHTAVREHELLLYISQSVYR